MSAHRYVALLESLNPAREVKAQDVVWLPAWLAAHAPPLSGKRQRDVLGASPEPTSPPRCS